MAVNQLIALAGESPNLGASVRTGVGNRGLVDRNRDFWRVLIAAGR